MAGRWRETYEPVDERRSADLMAAFGISINQASTDLNRYLGMAPGNMVYDKSARAYVRGDRFEPLFLKPDPASYLSQLRSISDGIVTQEETWIGRLPAFDTVPSPVRGIDAHTLRRVIEAIRTRQVPEVEYQTLFNPDPLTGVGSPRMPSISTASAGMRGPGASPTCVSRTSCWRASSASGPTAAVTWTPARMPTGTPW